MWEVYFHFGRLKSLRSYFPSLIPSLVEQYSQSLHPTHSLTLSNWRENRWNGESQIIPSLLSFRSPALLSKVPQTLVHSYSFFYRLFVVYEYTNFRFVVDIENRNASRKWIVNKLASFPNSSSPLLRDSICLVSDLISKRRVNVLLSIFSVEIFAHLLLFFIHFRYFDCEMVLLFLPSRILHLLFLEWRVHSVSIRWFLQSMRSLLHSLLSLNSSTMTILSLYPEMTSYRRGHLLEDRLPLEHPNHRGWYWLEEKVL